MEHLLVVVVLIITGYTSFEANVVEAKKAGGFTIDLIHHDSKLSPFYNESATLHDLSTRVALHSIARANRFSSQNQYVDGKSFIQPSVIPNGGTYLMRLSFGTPPLETYAITDTGSDLVWIQCGCGEGCYPQESRTFKSASSSTYRQLSCDTNYCRNVARNECGVNNECRYVYSYGDYSRTSGVLGSDTITFDSTNAQSVSFSGFVFGCGDDNEGVFSSRDGGIVGLGGGPLSLISQLGDQIEKKFSYCLPPISDNSASKLKFGSDSVLSGPGVVSTPFSYYTGSTFYTLTLEGISVGNKRIRNSEAGASNGSIIIDTGTTLTMLESVLYKQVEAAVRGEIPLSPVKFEGAYKLCYDRKSLGGVSEVSM